MSDELDVHSPFHATWRSLLGLGIDGLSMSSAWLPSVKYLVRAMSMADARALAAEALTMSSPKEIYAKCDEFYRARVQMD